MSDEERERLVGWLEGQEVTLGELTEAVFLLADALAKLSESAFRALLRCKNAVRSVQAQIPQRRR